MYSSNDEHDPYHAIDKLFQDAPDLSYAVQKRTCHPSLAPIDSPNHKRLRSGRECTPSELNTVSSQIQSLESRLAIATNHIALCNTQLQKITVSPASASSNKFELAHELELIVDTHDEDLKNLHKQITELEQQIELMGKEQKKMSPQKIATLCTHVKELQDKIAHAKLRDESFTRALKTHSSQLKSLQESITSHETRLQKLRADLTKSDDNRKTITAELINLAQRIETSSPQFAPLQEVLNKHDDRFLNLTRTQQTLQTELEQLKEREQQVAEQLQTFEPTMQQALATHSDDVRTLCITLEQKLNAQLQTVQDVTRGHTQDITIVTEELEQLKNLALSYAEFHEQSTTTLDEHTTKLKEHADEFKEIDTDLVDIHEQLAQERQQVAALIAWQQTFNPTTMQHTIDIHDSSLQQLNDDISGIRSELQQTQQVQQAQASSSSQQSSDQQILSTRIDIHAQEIETLKNALTLKDDYIAQHQQTYDQRFQELHTIVQTQNSMLVQLRDELQSTCADMQQLQQAQSSQESTPNVSFICTMLNTHAEEIQQLKLALASQACNTVQQNIVEPTQPIAAIHYQVTDDTYWDYDEPYIPTSPLMLPPIINDNESAPLPEIKPSYASLYNELTQPIDPMEALAREWMGSLYQQIVSGLAFTTAVERMNSMLSQIPNHYQLAHRIRMRLTSCYLDKFKKTGDRQFLDKALEIYSLIEKNELGAQMYGTYRLPDANRCHTQLTKTLEETIKKSKTITTTTNYRTIAPKG
jgi:chromosome segregation ATPase